MAEELDYIPMPDEVTTVFTKTWADSIKNK